MRHLTFLLVWMLVPVGGWAQTAQPSGVVQPLSTLSSPEVSAGFEAVGSARSQSDEPSHHTRNGAIIGGIIGAIGGIAGGSLVQTGCAIETSSCSETKTRIGFMFEFGIVGAAVGVAIGALVGRLWP